MNKKKPEIQDYPKVGDECYLRQYTSDYFINASRRPYTVIEVTDKEVKVQSCTLIDPIYNNPEDPERNGQRLFFYDTVAETILPNPAGRIEVLTWHPKRGMWGSKGLKETDYPFYAVFGKYEHYPYLN